MNKVRDEPDGGSHLYAIGLGSNRPLTRALGPHAIVEAAFAALDERPLTLIARSPIIASRPLGPSLRTYANAVALISTPLEPLALLDHLQNIEHRFHRRRYRRWGPRTLDLDMLVWSGGRVCSRRLTVPHPAFRLRAFVLAPLATVAPDLRDPLSGKSMVHLAARLAKPKPAASGNRSRR